MSIGEIRQGQVVQFTFTIKDQDNSVVDISGATAKTIRIKKPNNTVVERTASFTTDGTDGKLYIVTQNTDFSSVRAGYQAQAFVTLSGVVYPSDIYEFTVHGNIPAP